MKGRIIQQKRCGSRVLPVIAVAMALIWFGWTNSSLAQSLPPSQWSDPVVISPTDPALQPEDEPEEAATAAPQDLAAPLDQEQIDRIHAGAEASVLPILATHRQPPMFFPETVEREGVATLVDYGPRGPVFITASVVVLGAERVTIQSGRQSVEARVIADARFGLAILVPSRDVARDVEPIELLPVKAEDIVEVFSVGTHTMGATMGAGAGMFEFYQITTLGVTAGYPLVNRQGDLVGIGSHLYPELPGFSLSVPSEAVAAFIDQASP